MPVGYLNEKGTYQYYKCGYASVEEAQVFLSGMGAIERHQVQQKESCVDCLEYIIIGDNFKDFSEKILPSYLKF
jgi:hypothetical protein